jgi:hypothetical protein
MNKDIRVVPTPEGNWKVLINFIQLGIDYSDKKLAESEAKKAKKENKVA